MNHIVIKPTKKFEKFTQIIRVANDVRIAPGTKGKILLPDTNQVRRVVDHYIGRGLFTDITPARKAVKAVDKDVSEINVDTTQVASEKEVAETVGTSKKEATLKIPEVAQPRKRTAKKRRRRKKK